MQFRTTTRTDRWVGFLLSILIGGVFGSAFGVADFPVLACVIAIASVVLGIYMLLASEESLERIGKIAWFFW